MPQAEQILRFPNPSLSEPPIIDVPHRGQIVIVGANGSGKSRLGAWLENPASLWPNRSNTGDQPRHAYRLAAQRALLLPDHAERMEPRMAHDRLVRGEDGPSSGSSRVRGDPVVGQANDFGLLLNALFAERARQDRDYRERGSATGGNPGKPPEDTLTRLTVLWQRIFPERKIIIGDHLVQARPRGAGDIYSASALSDGERVGFYLAGHALLAPPNTRFVIDEPELHLHESIQSAIWEALEAARQDCVFVYITHDLAFAASRTRATKVVLYDYTAPTQPGMVGSWAWDVVRPTHDVPEDVVLRILGSRRPTLFVEGRTGSLDQEVYEALFPDMYIVPSGNWDSVDRSVRAFRGQFHLHHLAVSGVIDRDDRAADEIEALKEKGVHVLPVASVENLLVLPECVSAYILAAEVPESKRLARLADGKRRVLAAMARVRDDTIAERAQYAVRRRLGLVSRKGPTKLDLVEAVDEAVKASDAASTYDEAALAIDSALGAGGEPAFEATLSVFRNKAILAEFASAFGVDREYYASTVIAAIRSDDTLRVSIRRRLAI
ncbi:MAG TPA: AAA family ATPase [Candidatus Acidoferrum sp.]|nr:AAA family ATPase [Candidatus Acidoferrum sp.]